MEAFEEPEGLYEVSIPVFEGPMDLLLHLVSKNRIDIHDIPIHEITDQYLGYLRQAERFDLALGSSFFIMASTLVLIKSRMLLPRRRQEDGEEGEDPRQELVRSLEEFRRMKEIRARLEELMDAERPYRTRAPMELRQGVFTGEIPLKRLTAAFYVLYESMKGAEAETVLVPEAVSLEDQIEGLRGLLRQKGRILAHEFFLLQRTRMKLAVALIALLELIRTGEVALRDSAEGIMIKGAVE